MNVSVVFVDSNVWGRKVLSLSDIEPTDDLATLETAYVEDHHPAYVSVRLALEDLEGIRRFEERGFSLVECQLRLSFRFRSEIDVSRHHFEYRRVSSAAELDEVLCIASTAIVHDRFSMDRAVPRGYSGRRYEAYVRQSFEKSDEEVWRLVDPVDHTTLAFRTHRRISEDEVVLLLGGVDPTYKSLGLGVISTHYCINQMLRDGVRRATTHISLINKPIFDLEVTHFGFRYQQVFAVLRKCYP